MKKSFGGPSIRPATAVALALIVLATLWAAREIFTLRRQAADLRFQLAAAVAMPGQGVKVPLAAETPAFAKPPQPSPSTGTKTAVPKTTIPPSSLEVKVHSDGSVVLSDSRSVEIPIDPQKSRKLEADLRAARQAEETRRKDGPSYCAGKATGPPDSDGGGDSMNAWCPLSYGSTDWLELKFGKPAEVAQINIHECYATGALAKITALMPDGSEKSLWSGTEPAEPPPVERVVNIPPGIRSDRIRLYLDTSRIGTWQEIDAVELIGKDGSRQWASEAAASTFYGSEGSGGWSYSARF